MGRTLAAGRASFVISEASEKVGRTTVIPTIDIRSLFDPGAGDPTATDRAEELHGAEGTNEVR